MAMLLPNAWLQGQWVKLDSAGVAYRVVLGEVGQLMFACVLARVLGQCRGMFDQRQCT